MRNLKRVLSLALALVMVLGMMVITTSAATFTDDAEITNTEAVEVLYNLGIVDGMGDGTFAPNGTFTRAQAAKLIAYMLGYGKTAEKLSGAGLFTDVGVGMSNWAAGYIAFCASRNIIAGNGDGTFNPTGELTDIALGKMILVALGADAEEEGYVNDSNWAANVSIDMLEAGLVTNVTGEAISREDACAMILNGMKSGGTTIRYYDVYEVVNGENVYVDSFTSATDAYVMKDILNGVVAYRDVTVGTLLEEVHYVDCSDAPDEFGRPATTYEYAGWRTPLVYTAEPTLTYTTGVKSSAIYNALGLKANTWANWTINGHDAGAYSLMISKTNTSWKDFVIGGAGTTVEVYYNAITRAVTIVEVESFLAKVINVVDYKAATATTDEVKANITIEVAAGAYNGYEAVVYTDGYKKGDMVVVTGTGIESDALDVTTIAPVTTVTGYVDKYTTSTMTVDGVVYNAADCGNAIGTPSFTTEYKLYVVGNTVYKYVTVDPTIPTNYVYVVNTEFKAGSTGSLVANTTNAAKANVFFADGTNAVIDLAIDTKRTAALGDDTVVFPKKDGAVTEQVIATVAARDDGKRTVGNWFAYEVEEDGTYTLSAVDATFAVVPSTFDDFAEDTAWTNGGKYMTSATVVAAIDAYGNVTTFTGLPAEDVDLSGTDVLYTYGYNSNLITNIYIYGADLSSTPDTVYAYAAKQGETTAKGTEWTLYVGGETVTYVISNCTASDGETAEDVARGTVYELEKVTSGAYAGTYTLTNVEAIGDGVKVTVADTTYFVAGSMVEYARSYAVYNVATGVYGTVDTIEVGDYVVVAKTNTDSEATLIYIVAEAE